MVRSSSCTRSRPPSDRPLHLIAHSPAFARTLQYGQWSSPRTLLVGAFWCVVLAVEAAAFAPPATPPVRGVVRAAERTRIGPRAALSLRMVSLTDRVFTPDGAQGGRELEAASTALIMIEYQNEFCAEGGKLHDAVKDVMAR